MQVIGPDSVWEKTAVAHYGALRSAPQEYLDVLPWQVVDGVRYISQDDLSDWAFGDTPFGDRASAEIARRADAAWRAAGLLQ